MDLEAITDYYTELNHLFQAEILPLSQLFRRAPTIRDDKDLFYLSVSSATGVQIADTLRCTRCAHLRSEFLWYCIHWSRNNLGLFARVNIAPAQDAFRSELAQGRNPLLKQDAVAYLVLGIFSPIDRQPVERLIFLKDHEWILDCLNGRSIDVANPGGLSLEVVLGWSPTRISIALLSPVILSLAIGILINSADWNGLATSQTAWGIASYIATAGGLVAAVLAIVSGLTDN